MLAGDLDPVGARPAPLAHQLPARRRRCWKRAMERWGYFNFAYSALASFKAGTSGSASFQIVRKP
jgi:hypothetical protein